MAVARFLVVLKPGVPLDAAAMLEALQPVLEGLRAEIEHRTPAHLSAMIRGGGETQRMQLFADVQSKADGKVLELVLLSREAMGTTAPHTREVFKQLLELIQRHVPSMPLTFRSDRDGPLPIGT
ncbi:hypothetical protein KBY74_02405 [Cyanobium sp. A1C-AMD]|uniref:hypothetical protein n=1 Tax=Cyanobium sp. Maggiore-St4-Cus TaxID=2823717 RepID=UPI0020CD93DA|nr:hypothetical protein [Cyanobium sp. Maggiore-St4-Cus]MCP9878718.1 hypothetical protein [Cyanobium sp. A1C-AMD]